jgi:hypothetical protein
MSPIRARISPSSTLPDMLPCGIFISGHSLDQRFGVFCFCFMRRMTG